MPEQSAHQQIGIDKTDQQNYNDQKGEKYEYNRQRCSGLLRGRQRVQ